MIASLSALWGRASVIAQAPAAQTCEGPVVRATGEAAVAWGASLTRLRERLSSLPDVDRCAEVELLAESTHVLVMIRLADGRVALRRVDTLIAAMDSVEALLTVLPDTKVEATGATEEPKKDAAAPRKQAESREGQVPKPAPPAGRVVEISVGVGATARLAGHPWFVGYGLAAHVDVAINRWLLGSWLRWDIQDRLVEGHVPRQFIASSFLLGAFTGRRFVLGSAALDVVVGPNLVIDTEEAAGTEGIDIGGELGSLSLAAALRVLVPRHGSPGFFGMLGGDVNPSRVNRRVRADPALPTLPAWGSSLVLGVAWGGL